MPTSAPYVRGTCLWALFNENATGILALATIALVAVTFVYVVLVWKQVNEVKKQGEKARRRAVWSVIIEIWVNDLASKFKERAPFMDEVYPASIWALTETEMAIDTAKAIADAHLSAKRFNAVFDPSGRSWEDQNRLFSLAQSSLEKAREAIKKDSKLLESVGCNLSQIRLIGE